MHPEIVSGIGIATNNAFGTENSLSSNDMIQFLLEQNMKLTLARASALFQPPTIACPLPNRTIE